MHSKKFKNHIQLKFSHELSVLISKNGLEIKDVAVGAGGFRFDSRAGLIGHSVTVRHRRGFFKTGAKRRRWLLNSLPASAYYREYNEDLILIFSSTYLCRAFFKIAMTLNCLKNIFSNSSYLLNKFRRWSHTEYTIRMFSDI